MDIGLKMCFYVVYVECLTQHHNLTYFATFLRFRVAKFCTILWPYTFLSGDKTLTLALSFPVKEAKVAVGTTQRLKRVTRSAKFLILRKKYVVPHGVLTPLKLEFLKNFQLREGAAQNVNDSQL